MDINEMKEVRFDKYCRKCEHWNLAVTEEPCNSCLEEPVNLHSHKPVKYEERE